MNILERIKNVVENYYNIEDLCEKDRSEPLPTARKMYTKIANEKYRGKVNNVMSLIGKSHSSYSTNLKAANIFLEIDKTFMSDYQIIIDKLEGAEGLIETTNYIRNFNIIDPIVC